MADDQERVKIIFDTNAGEAAKETNQLGSALDSSEESAKSFKTQMREANAELQRSIQLYGETAEETIKAAKAVAELKDQMGFAKDLADSFNPDQKMKALGAATQVAGTAMQGVTAGMALFGAESEDTQKKLLQVQAAMAFSDAISQMSDLGDQWALLKTTIANSTIATKANAAATGAAAMVQNLFTGSVNATSTGFKALKMAIAATGIGLLVVGISMLVTNFDKVRAAVLKVVPGLAKVGDMVMSIVNAVTDFIGITSEADRAADRLKANAERRSKEIDRILKEDGSRYSESAKKKMAIEKQLQDDIASGLYNEQKLRKEAAFAMAQIDKENAENRKKKLKEEADERAKLAKEEAEKQKKNQKDAEDAAKEKARLEAERAHEAYLQLQNDTADVDAFLLERKEKQEAQDTIEAERVAFNYQVERTTEDQKLADEKVRADLREEINDRSKDNAEKLLAFAASGAIKNKAIQKAAIVAEGGVAVGRTVKNTAEAIAQDLKLGFPFNIAPIALDAAVGATSIASIVSGTNKALQAVGGGSIGGASINRPNQSNSPSVAFNNTAENQIGQSISKSQSDQPPIKVFVAESDITKSQNNVKVLVKENTF